MLQITDIMQTCDAKANNIISIFVSERLATIIAPLTKANTKTLSSYFPVGYPKCKMKAVINDLYALLRSEAVYVPALILEYVLFESITKELRHRQMYGISTIEKIPYPDRKLILSAIKSSFDTDDEEDLDFAMSSIEDMSDYPESCFWDWDFQFLDEITEEELYESDTNKVLGIGSKESIMYVPGQIHY